MKFTQIALLGAVAIVNAQPHRHAHAHLHADKRAPSLVERRGDAVVYAPGPTVTVYELDGKDISPDDVAAGLRAGYYTILSDSSTSTSSYTSTSTSSSESSSSSPTSSSTALAAQFYEHTKTSSAEPTTSSTSTPAPPTSTAAPTPAKSTPAAAVSTHASGGVGLGSSFPSGTIPCSQFPSAYGAVAADWLGLSKWIGIQQVPGYDSLAASISYISTCPVGSNGDCTANSFCSYMCPPGYQKSQWPSAQGSTGQSIGGLYCNSEGMLELSRPSVPQLCVAGTGQVLVENTLSSNVAICRTDYPGTESETVAMNAEAGQTEQLTCPDATTYYMWNNKFTSAQYYVNPRGVPTSTACQWQNSDTPGNWWGNPGNIGNWAPVNLGVGKGSTGETFISIFQNAPVNTLGTLDFNIKITGGVSGDCKYENGEYYSNGVVSPSGCTVSVSGTATFVFY